MRRLDQSLIGVELHPKEIRVVQVKYQGGTPQVVSADFCPMPPDSMARGQITNSGAVALALQKLLDNLGLKGDARVAIAGPSVASVFRRLSVPPAPDSELYAMVENEVQLYQILRTNGAFDYLKLEASASEVGEEMQAVMVAAIEEAVLSGLQGLEHNANIEIDSFEPVHFSMLRSAVAGSEKGDPLFTILVADTHTDLALIHEGKLWFYRRLEVGSDVLIAAASTGVSADGSIPSGPIDPTALGRGPAIDLAMEIQRSIEYLEREYHGIPQITKMKLVVNEPSLEPLSSFFYANVNVPTELIYASNFSVGSADQALTMGPEGVRYIAATGLALRNAGALVAGAPKVDLFSTTREHRQMSMKKRNFAGAILTSLAAIAFGFVASNMYGGQITQVKRDTVDAVQRAEAITRATNEAMNAQALKAEQYVMLRKEGVPLTVIMDYLQQSLRPGVGISAMSINGALGTTIVGDSLDESSLIGTVESLQKVPVFTGVSIQSFDRKLDRNQNPSGLTFTLFTSTITMDRVQLPGEAEADAKAKELAATKAGAQNVSLNTPQVNGGGN